MLLLVALMLIATPAIAHEPHNIGDLQVRVNSYGALEIGKGDTKVVYGGLFMAQDKDQIDARFFQNFRHVKTEPIISGNVDGYTTFDVSGQIFNKELDCTYPFIQKFTVSPEGILQIDCRLEIPADVKFKEMPRLLLEVPGSVVAGRGLELQSEMSTDHVVVPEIVREGERGVAGSRLDGLRIATTCGTLEFSAGNGNISFHDTRYYQPDKGLRIDLKAIEAEPGVHTIRAVLKLPVGSEAQALLPPQTESGCRPEQLRSQDAPAGLPHLQAVRYPQMFLMAAQGARYTPDFAAWDIYLPHLNRTPLSGWWRLKLLEGTDRNPKDDQGTTERYFAEDFDASAWDQVMVPQTWRSTRYLEAGNPTVKKRRDFNGVGWYRKTFKAPAVPEGQRSILRFEEIAMEGAIYLNGRLVGTHKNFRIKSMRRVADDFEIDVTDALRPGETNVLAVRIYQGAEPSWTYDTEGGILDAVWLDIRPDPWVAAISIAADADLQGISYRCLIGSSTASVPSPRWNMEVFEWSSGTIIARAMMPTRVEAQEDGRRWLTGSMRIPQARTWSCESPFLYGMRVTDSKGRIAGVKRFGIRTFTSEDGSFLLNGRPVTLRGLVKGFELATFMPPLFIQNEGNVLRRYFQRCRDANINHIRLHTMMLSPIAYDLLDEIGILVCDELTYPATPILNPTKADEIANVDALFACDPEGNVKPQFLEQIKHRLDVLSSHPCVAMFSYGNEIRDERLYRQLTTNLYDFYKSYDVQQRPITPSSGRFWKEASNLKSLVSGDKLDYIDTHDYTGSINNWPVAFCEPVAEKFIRIAKEAFGDKQIPPIVNGETVYFENHYYPSFYGDIWESEDATEPDWKKYIWTLTELKSMHPDHARMSYYWVRNWGTKAYKYNRDAGRAWYLERILDVQRKLWPDLDGFEALVGDFFVERYNANHAEYDFPPNAAYESMKQVCAPAVVVLDYVAPNRFTGDRLQLKATVVNNSESRIEQASVGVALKRNGVQLKFATERAGALAVGEKREVLIGIDVPDDLEEGPITLAYALLADSRIVCDRKLNLNIRDRRAVFAPIKSNASVLLYDGIENVFTGMNRPSTTQLLKAFDVPFESIRDFDRLDSSKLLVIGSDSIDAKVLQNSDKIRQHLDQGGRLLVFEQQFTGRLPFATELEIGNAGYGQFAEIVRGAHDAVRGMRQAEFHCWNQKNWAIYRKYIRPLSEATILAGGDSTTWGSDSFGMIVAQGRLGRGTLTLCQAEVTMMFNSDSAAAMLARNLLVSAMKATASEGLPAFRAKPTALAPLDAGKAVPLSLGAVCNMGFADDIPGDGRGGWTDQGPQNDLRQMPSGSLLLNNLPFQVIDPTVNNGKSCIIVSANPQLKFPSSVGPIRVDQKFERIAFLHSSAWTPSKGIVGKYTVIYDDGSSDEIPVVSGVNIADWWGPGASLTEAESVWTATNGESVIGVFAYVWRNPQPERVIRGICIQSAGNAVIGLLAITGQRI